MHTLCSQLGTIGTSKCVVNKSLELVVASSPCKISHDIGFPRGGGVKIWRLTTEIRRVGVHPVEVGGPFHDGPFFRSEFGKTITKYLFHVLRIMSEIYWVLQKANPGYLIHPHRKDEILLSAYRVPA